MSRNPLNLQTAADISSNQLSTALLNMSQSVPSGKQIGFLGFKATLHIFLQKHFQPGMDINLSGIALALLNYNYESPAFPSPP